MKKFLDAFIRQLLRYLLKPLSFVPAICMMYVIYSFSAQDGSASASVSLKVSEIVVTTADKVLDRGLTESEKEEWVDKIHFYVRKCGHFTEYFVLAVTFAFPLYVYGVRGIWLVFLAGGFCVGFACLDEFHQSFVAGRTPSKRDVLIDSGGVLLGILMVRIFGFIGRRTIFRGLSSSRRSD